MKLDLQQQGFKALKNFVSLVSVIAEEATFTATEEKISVMEMDPSHVAMIDTSLKAQAFESYHLSEKEEENQVSVNIQEFKKFLDRVDEKNEHIQIYVSSEKARLIIKTKVMGRERRFEVPILEQLDTEMPQPKIKFTSRLRITSDALALAVKDANLVSEHIVMSTKNISNEKKGFYISGEGDMGSAFSDWETGTEDILEIEVDDDGKSTYTLSYVNPIVNQCKSVGEVITLELTDDMPLKIEAESSDPNLEAVFYLAPCIGV